MTDRAPIEAGRARVARNAALQAAAEVVGKIATLALTLVATRALTKAAFGAYAYALNFAPLVGVLWSWGLGTLVIREAAAHPDRLPRLFSQFMFLRSALTLPAVIVFGAVGAAVRPDPAAAAVLVLVLVAQALNSLREAGVSAGVARQQMGGVTIAVVVDRLATAALGIAVLLAGFGVIALGISFLLGSLAGMVVAQVAVRRLGIRFDRRLIDRSDLLPMFKRSFYIGIDTIVSQALFRIDAVMLSAFRGDAALAAYAVAYRLLETVLFISWAIVRALFPAMSAGGRKQVRRGLEEGIAGLAVLYVPFGIALLVEAPRLIPFLFGDQYGSTAATVARWLAAGPLLFGISYLAGFGLQSLGRPKQAFYATLAAGTFNVAFNLVLIPTLGAIGAAITTIASYALEAVVSLWMLAPTTGPIKIASRMVAPVGASVLMTAVLLGLGGHVLLDLAAAGVVYLGAWYVIARRVSPQQIEMLSTLLPWRR